MVYEQFTPSPQRVRANVIPDYMIHDKPTPSHLPGGGKPPWDEDGQSCFRREGEESVRSYKTTKIDNVAKPGQKRLEGGFNTNNNNSAAEPPLFPESGKLGAWANRRKKAEVRLGELEADFREARRGREEAAARTAATAAAAAAAVETSAHIGAAPRSAEGEAFGAMQGYLPSSPTAHRRHSPTATSPLPEA